MLTSSGPFMIPLVAAAVFALFFGAQFARTMRRSFVPLAAGLAGSCLLIGLLSFTTGVARSLEGIGGLGADQRWIVLYGVAESLTAFSVALLIGLVVGILLTVGFFRVARRQEQAGQDRTLAAASA